MNKIQNGLNRSVPRYPDLTPLTQEEVELLPDDGYRYEWWEGRLRVSPAAAYLHNNTVFRFLLRLGAYLQAKGIGDVAEVTEIRIDGVATLIPDFVLLLGEKETKALEQPALLFAPDGVGEAISPHGEKRDRIEKKALYEKIGVRWYFVLDPSAHTLELYTLGPDGRYGEPAIWKENEIVTLPDFSGLAIPLAQVWR